MIQKKKSRKTKPPLRLVAKRRLRNASEDEAISAIVSVYLENLEAAGVSFAAAVRDPMLDIYLPEGTKVPEALAREIERAGKGLYNDGLDNDVWTTAHDYLTSVVHEAVHEAVMSWLDDCRAAKRAG